MTVGEAIEALKEYNPKLKLRFAPGADDELVWASNYQTGKVVWIDLLPPLEKE